MTILDKDQESVLFYLNLYRKGNSLNREAAELIEELASKLEVAERHLESVGAGGVSKMQ